MIMISRYFLIGFLIQLVVFNTLFGKNADGQLASPVHANLQNVSVKQVFNVLKKSANVTFVYDAGEINCNQLVDIKGEDLSGAEVLDKLASQLDLSFKKIGNTITVRKKYAVESSVRNYSLPALIATAASTLNYISPQKTLPLTPAFTVSGTVSDGKGNPLIGVSVEIKGTRHGTVTDTKGHYMLQAPQNSTLTFSYIGYETQDVAVAGKDILDIVMKTSNTGLNQVVVIGYGTQKKQDLTSAITTVNTKLLDDRSLTTLSSALEGITPGVYIRQENGRPGMSGASVDIRGASLSTFSNNPPLVIIDGVVDNIDDINPADVASISILKDAAASAIYGARATGGVILITTKRGSAGKVTVSYNGTYGLQRQPYGDLKFVNTATWMKANNEAAELDGSPDIYTPAQIAQYTDSKNPQYPESTQWTSWIAKTAPQQTHNISIKGGNDKINFFLSGGLLIQRGFIPHDSFTRKNVLLNLDYHPIKRLKISTNIAYLRDDQSQPGIDYNGGVYGEVRNAIFTPPTEPLYNPNGTFNNNVIWGSNPVYNVIYGGTELTTVDNLRMSLALDYEIVKGLSLDVTTATLLDYAIDNSLYPKIPYYDANGNVLGYSRSDVTVVENWSKSDYVNNQFLLNYKKDFGLHNLKVMGGLTYENQYDKSIEASATQFPNNAIREIAGTTGSGSQISGTSAADEWTINSVIGRLNYSYNDKYLFQATARYDGSSRFSPDKRWGLFPSFSAGWRISQESFMKNASFISELKLRASWGQLGNEGSNEYPFAQTVSTSGQAVFGNGIVSTATLGGPVNLALTWERQTSENIGLDFGFLKNRLTGSFDHFNEQTTGIIGTPPVPTTFGTSAPLSNLYGIDMRGFELELHWKDHIGSFEYFIGFNLSNSFDKVVNLAGLGTTNQDSIFGKEPVVLQGEQYMQVGKAQGQWYLLKTDGLFTSQAQINKSAYQTSLTRPGDIHYVDANGDGVINSDDMRPIGKTSTPHYFFGANLGASFKGFDLSVIINGVWERWSLKNLPGSYLSGVRPGLALLQSNYDARWTPQDPNQWAKVPRLTQDNWIGNLSNIFQDSEWQLANFGYLRVKNIQLGYTLPKRITEKLTLTKVRFYISTENLFTYKPGYIESIDPESLDSYDPNASEFFGPDKLTSFGINVTF